MLVNWQPQSQRSFNTNDPITFSWTADAQLAPDQFFELVFWQPGESWGQGRSPYGATRGNSFTFTASSNSISGAYLNGDYRWGVLLVQLEPEYRRLGLLGGDYAISFTGGSGSGNDNNGGGNNNDTDNTPMKPVKP
jgi:hypothetical protein